MNMPVNETRQLKLPEISCSRTYPFSSRGDAQLRAIQNYYQDKYNQKNPDVQTIIPFPTAIHLMMEEFCKDKGIELLEGDQE